jgi:superfamily II DNA/RNA helicase
MPGGIRQLAMKIMNDPVEISLAVSTPAEGIDQKAYLISNDQKNTVLKHVLGEKKDYDSILIFTSTKSKISEIVKALGSFGFPAKGISSNLDQNEREKVLREFRSKKTRILVATDVMSRGIDVKDINLVINYDVPRDAEDYVHRVGRTARVNAKGEAVTLVTPKEMHLLKKIERLIKKPVPKVQLPEGLEPATEKAAGEVQSRKKKFPYQGRKNFRSRNDAAKGNPHHPTPNTRRPTPDA